MDANAAFVVPQQSTPSFSEFYPHIPYQRDVINDVFFNFDYSLGVHEVLLSGSVGSAKTLLMAHCGLRHAFENIGAVVLIGRQGMPDLRDTIYAKILEHLIGSVKPDGTQFKEGTDFGFADGRCQIWLSNRSQFIARSWADKRFKRLGSLDVSAACIEELTENGADHWPFYAYLKTRVGRLPHIRKSWIMCATNPDGPAHPAYDYFEIAQRMAKNQRDTTPTKHVYFSSTRDNPFLPPTYADNLERDLDPKLKLRLVDGLWVEITTEVVYHAYDSHNFRSADYDLDPLKPIYISFDFNIGQGKPMSACLSQVEIRAKRPVFHFYAAVLVEGADTEDLVEEMIGRGLLDAPTDYVIHGDATGGSRSTKSKTTDYDIIRKRLSSHRHLDGTACTFEIDVPRSNPPVRTRHNTVNAYCRNARGERGLFVYRGAKDLDKGFRLTALKRGGQYIEDDSKPWQHVTTAAGYHICRLVEKLNSRAGLRMETIR